MAQGIRIWDASGNLIMDSSSRVGRVMGQVLTTASTSGSISVPDFSQGTPFFFLLPVNKENFTSGAGKAASGTVWPKVTISGTTLSWTGGTQSYIVYGIY